MKFRLAGTAPEDHERRCQARSKNSGDRCRMWAVTGLKFCRMHARRSGRRSTNPARGIGKSLGSFDLRYKRYLGKTLSERIQELNDSGGVLDDLSAELELMRSLVVDSLVLYNAASEHLPEHTEEQRAKKRTSLVMAGEMVRDAVNQVRDMVVSIAKVRDGSKERVSVFVLNDVVHQMTTIVTQAVAAHCEANQIDPEPLMARIAVAVDEQLRLPAVEDGSTVEALDPQADVDEMDGTVPAHDDTPPGDELPHNSNGHRVA